MERANKYRRLGLKLTPQRMAIMDYLEGNTQHPSAEDIYENVRRKFPTMSLATVYTTIAALKNKGNILELTIDPEKRRYDPQTGLHHHLICTTCKRIVDIPGEYQIALPEAVKQDFSITQNHIEFYGLCPECKKRKN